MARPTTAVCARLKTAIAEEVGMIQGMSERFIAESNDYLINRIPQGQFDADAGEDPKTVRYSTAPVADAPYVDILTQGNESSTMPARDNCSGATTEQDAIIDKRGAFGCNLPGETISGGYDEFYRVLKGKAWETEPFCAMDLILKKHYNPYINMLRTDLPKRAMEQFGYSLERNVIEMGWYNTSVVNGFTTAKGAFPAIPEGALDLNTIRRAFTLMEVQGWTGPREAGPISHSAFETMRANYKLKEGVELQSTIDSDETRYTDGQSRINWGGITWVLTSTPSRGYLVAVVGGGYEFVPVRPTTARQGTGEGIVTDVNNDYFDCRFHCDGQTHELYEIGYYVSPNAAKREAFAMPSVGGLTFSQNAFNFEVVLVDGAYLECNEDNLKGKFRLKHAYAFNSDNPEAMGAFIYRVTPDCVNVVAPCCDTECAPAPGNEIAYPAPDGPTANGCSTEDCDPAACDDMPTNLIDPLPTQDDPCPAPSEGIAKLATCGPVLTELTGSDSEVCVWIERTGGSLGAASVDYTTADGTAIAATDYTTTAGTLNWADGENDRKKVCIPVLAAATAGRVFDFTLSNAVGATLADGTTTGCATLEIQLEPACA